MKLYFKNKLISFGDDSTVSDEKGDLIYKVDGKMFSPTKKKRIYDKDKNLLYIVRNKFWHAWNRSAFIYDANKNLIAKVTDKFFSLKGYVVEGYKDELSVRMHTFSDSTIYKGEEPFATFKRELVVLKDSFVIDGPEEEMPFLVALITAIDGIMDKKRQDNK